MSYPYKDEVLATKYAYIPDDAANAPLVNGLMLIGMFVLFAVVLVILLTTRELSKRLSRMSSPVGSVLQLLLDIMMNLKSLPSGRRAGIQ